MPCRPRARCSWPLCPDYALKEGRCRRHYLEGKKLTNAAYRGNSAYSASGGSRRWRRIRANQLAQEPLCRTCKAEGRLTPAVTVDHITPRNQGGDDAPTNLQSLCHAHHVAKTKDEREGKFMTPPLQTKSTLGGLA
jgi:5-methylcytosine-specific restriction protein A